MKAVTYKGKEKIYIDKEEVLKKRIRIETIDNINDYEILSTKFKNLILSEDNIILDEIPYDSKRSLFLNKSLLLNKPLSNIGWLIDVEAEFFSKPVFDDEQFAKLNSMIKEKSTANMAYTIIDNSNLTLNMHYLLPIHTILWQMCPTYKKYIGLFTDRTTLNPGEMITLYKKISLDINKTQYLIENIKY